MPPDALVDGDVLFGNLASASVGGLARAAGGSGDSAPRIRRAPTSG